MIDRSFWEEARRAWIVQAPPKIKDVHIGSGGDIDPSLLVNPWDMDEIPFDMVDFEGATRAAFEGGEIPLKPGIGKPGQRPASGAAPNTSDETEAASAMTGTSPTPVDDYRPPRAHAAAPQSESSGRCQALPYVVGPCTGRQAQRSPADRGSPERGREEAGPTYQA